MLVYKCRCEAFHNKNKLRYDWFRNMWVLVNKCNCKEIEVRLK